MRPPPAIFYAPGETYRADTCEPLRAAEREGKVRLEALARGSYPGRRLKPKVLPEVCSVGYWDAARPQSWGLPWHRNEGLELTYLSRGRLSFSVDGEAVALKRGDLTVTRPWQRHRVGDPHVSASKLYWLILDVGIRRPDDAWRWPGWIVLDPQDAERLTDLLRHNERPVWSGDAGIGRAFERLGEAVEADAGARSASRLALHVNELFVRLLEMLERRKVALDRRLSSTERTVELFLAALSNHLAHEWDLEAMAEECGLARTRFAHYCRLLTNATPAEYLARCRVDAAAQMLAAHPERSITRIALECGFGSSQYFATVFRRLRGCSPRAFRAQADQAGESLRHHEVLRRTAPTGAGRSSADG